MTTATNPETGERLELIDGQWVPIPPQTPTLDPRFSAQGLMEQQAQRRETLSNLITGAPQQTRATQELPELGFGGLLSTLPALEVGKIAPALLLSGPEERAQILSQLPDIGIITDEKGNKIAVNKQTGAHSVIQRPGLSGGDIVQGAAMASAFTPAAAFAGAGRTVVGGGGAGAIETLKNMITSRLSRGILGAGATQAGLETGQALSGGTFDPGEITTAGLLGGTGEVLGPLAQRLRTPGRTPAEKIISRELTGAFPGPESVQQQLTRLGPEGRLVDIPPLTGLGIGAAIKSPAARQRVGDFLATRARGASTRVKSLMRKEFGAKGADFNDFLDDTIARRAEEAGPLYEAARQKAIQPQAVDDLVSFIDDIANNEKVSGHTEARNALKKLKKTLFHEVDGETVPKTSVDGIDISRETFGGKIFKLRQDKSISPKLYDELVKVRNKFDDILPEEYIQANTIFSSESNVIDAFNTGKKIFTLPDDELVQLTRGMSAADREGLMSGVAKAISQKVGKKVPTGKLPRALETEEFADKLSLIMPDEGAVDNFLSGIEKEGVFSATRQAIVGGSQTALNTAATQRITAKAEEAIPLSIESVKRKFLARKGVTEKIATDVSDLLTQNFTPAQIKTFMEADIPPEALPSALRASIQLLREEQSPERQDLDELIMKRIEREAGLTQATFRQ